MEVRPIDANALAEVVNETITDYTESQRSGFFGIGIRKGLNDAYREIINFPTLDYAPVRHGEWMDNVDENGFLRNAWRKCSACGGLNYSKKPNYCPNCGAKMDGGK